ncbi:biotin--[acetyl-CoA-carboxylase] ligase [soil metagenome]
MEQAGVKVIEFDSIGSTSLHAREMLRRGEIDLSRVTVLVAAAQTGGVGQRGRAWASPRGGVWMTLVMGAGAARGVEPFGAALGLRIGRAMLGGVDWALRGSGMLAALKLPNDVVINGKKVAGVLSEIVESAGKPVALVGVGINADFGVEELPEILRQTATTLRAVRGGAVDVTGLRDVLIARLEQELRARPIAAEVIAEITPRLAGIGTSGPVTLADGRREVGVLRGLSPAGHAVYEVGGARVEIASGRPEETMR